MVLIRPAAFRAPLARFARPATRASPWQQSFQRTARRGYASASDVTAKASSDLPWIAVGTIITVPSVYYILSSIETGGHHAEGHGEEHHEEGENEAESESKDEPEAKEEDSKSDDSEDKGESKESGDDEKPADDKEDENAHANADKPDARKEPVKHGMSDKQQGISNADTKHSTDTHDGSKSTKGEGVAETAKLKGTVQSDRPGAESAQKGQANQDKSK
ncbi:hypothetical protein BU16DRAFT_622396 [Lophium mytilinum]|uniref:Cylicin I n=1 Tax=Lophium mytilinum TaxID=390894 RepID=A0A6A6QCP8_9PEZI|nr:hypothetical protein BU16DRAFT_622396 [Lophium mytilinum]